jgi:4-coumarate--CoA ligase
MPKLGVSVAPAELEHLLIGHKDVVNAAVIAVSDDSHGEIPMAFVTVVEGSDVTGVELVEYVDSQVNDHKKLRGGLRIVDSFPVTPSGKIKKTQLLENILF